MSSDIPEDKLTGEEISYVALSSLINEMRPYKPKYAAFRQGEEIVVINLEEKTDDSCDTK